MTPKRKNVIFDLDGTLSDTAKATYEAIISVQLRYQLPPITNEHVKRAMGLAGLEFYRHIYPSMPEEALREIEPVVDALEEETINKLGEAILFPGVKEMLESLKQIGCKLYIASTGSQSHVYTTLRAAGIESFFEGIHCAEPVKIDMVKKIIKESNPDGWLMVGDMYKDLEAAKANDVLALGAGFGYLDKADYALFDTVLKVPADLLAYC